MHTRVRADQIPRTNCILVITSSRIVTEAPPRSRIPARRAARPAGPSPGACAATAEALRATIPSLFILYFTGENFPLYGRWAREDSQKEQKSTALQATKLLCRLQVQTRRQGAALSFLPSIMIQCQRRSNLESRVHLESRRQFEQFGRVWDFDDPTSRAARGNAKSNRWHLPGTLRCRTA